MPSRLRRWSWIVVLAAGCGDEVPGGGVASRDSARLDGLTVGGPVAVGEAVLPIREGFRQEGLKIGAAGSHHRIELAPGVTRIRALLTAGEVRRWRTSLLQRSAHGRSSPLASALPRLASPSSPWELTTRSVSREGFEGVTGHGALTVAADGVAHRAFSGCREDWTNGPQGSEVAYHLAERPAGTGDLRITVGVHLGAGAPVVSSDVHGLHFQSTTTGARLIYGHATWVDATGRRTAVPARWTGDAIQLVVPAGVVDGASYPATLDPLVGPDLGTDTPVLTQASAGSEPVVASDGSQFLAVFGDAQRIRAVRVDAAGHVLERDWIDLGEDGMLQFEPAVAFGGGHYLVAWWQDDGTNVTIRARLVNPDGTVVGASSFAVSSQTGFDAALAWNGSAFLAAWLGFDDVSAIRVATVDGGGHVVPGSEHVVSGDGFAGHPALAIGTSTAVLAWEDGTQTTDFTSRIRSVRLGLDGTLLDTGGGVRLSTNETNEEHPRVASDGHHFLVTWHQTGAPGSVQGAVVADIGENVIPAFPVSRSTGEASWPSVAFNGSQFAVAWKDERSTPAIEGALVSPDGVVAGATDTVLSNVPATSSGSFDSTGLAWNGTELLLVFQGDRASPGGDVVGIEGSLIGPDLALVPGLIGLSQLRAGELAPTVVWTGRSYLVSWIDQRTGSFDGSSARAVRISAAGEILDPDGLALSDGLPAFGQVASNADGRAVVTLAPPNGSALFRFVGADGRLTASRVLADRIVSASSIAGNGSAYLAMLDTMHPDFTFDLSVRVVRANGTLGAEVPVESGVSGTGSLVAAGDGYLVSSTTAGGELFPVSANGRVGQPVPLPLAGTSMSSATNGTRSLVTWTPASGDLPFAAEARFFANGAFRGATLELAPTTTGSPAALAWDGHSYWAAWAVSVTDAQGVTVSRPFIRSISTGGALGPVSALFDGPCEGPALASNERRQLLLSCYAFTNQFRVVMVSTRLVDTSRAAGP